MQSSDKIFEVVPVFMQIALSTLDVIQHLQGCSFHSQISCSFVFKTHTSSWIKITWVKFGVEVHLTRKKKILLCYSSVVIDMRVDPK